MEPEFWHNAWARSDKPGWQQDSVNAALAAHWRAGHSTVFVPLCGCSPDLAWLRDQGHSVIGVDLSAVAIQRFFDERSIPFKTETVGNFVVFRAEGYTLYAR